jgi:hypothetical protein
MSSTRNAISPVWLRGRGMPSETVAPSPGLVSWPAEAPALEWPLADRDNVRSAFSEMLTTTAPYRIWLLDALECAESRQFPVAAQPWARIRLQLRAASSVYRLSCPSKIR